MQNPDLGIKLSLYFEVSIFFHLILNSQSLTLQLLFYYMPEKIMFRLNTKSAFIQQALFAIFNQ
jgi:hypothetical protein